MLNMFKPKSNHTHWHWADCAVFITNNDNVPGVCNCGYVEACKKWWKILWFHFCICYACFINFSPKNDTWP